MKKVIVLVAMLLSVSILLLALSPGTLSTRFWVLRRRKLKKWEEGRTQHG